MAEEELNFVTLLSFLNKIVFAFEVEYVDTVALVTPVVPLVRVLTAVLEWP